jgi:hypothetical protein
MAVYKTNFMAGLVVGVAVAVALPLVGTEVFATLSGPAQATVTSQSPLQTVNRAGKADRLHPSHNAIGRSAPKAPKILEGCDPAFSPLSKGAASNFSGRCLA